jgi:hypothetical protein
MFPTFIESLISNVNELKNANQRLSIQSPLTLVLSVTAFINP